MLGVLAASAVSGSMAAVVLGEDGFGIMRFGALALFLHETGAVFYEPGQFGERLILDQKWAVDAIYVVDNASDPETAAVLDAHAGLPLVVDHTGESLPNRRRLARASRLARGQR